MITPAEIMKGMAEKNRRLTSLNDEYIDFVEKRAQAERDFNVSVAKKTLELKEDGQSITIINTLVKGDKLVAELKLKMDVAEGMEKVCLLKIKETTSAIDTYRSLLTWQRAEMLRSE